MLVIGSEELRKNQKMYFDLAEKEQIFIKRGKSYIELVKRDVIRENPSPSRDPYFEDPRNIAELDRRIVDYDSGKEKKITLTPEMQKELFK